MKKIHNLVAEDATTEVNVAVSMKTRSRVATPTIWKVLEKARRVFDAQLTKTNEVKLRCIEKFMNAATLDVEKFWGDYMEQASKLLDSKRYERECQTLGVNAENLATHIVFLGSATINKVFKYGIGVTLKRDYSLYTDPFIPQSTKGDIVNNIDEIVEAEKSA